ncbi:Beta-lactamase [Salinisphaera sp. PC39]
MTAGLRWLLAACVLATGAVQAQEWREDAEIGQLFRKAGLRGTFVVYDAGRDRLTGHDRSRANNRYVPASTFKVPHTLIGLSVAAVADVDEVVPYGGEPQPFAAWERDMSLREAIAVSNLAVYRTLARRIGLARMRDGVSRLGFGNGEIGTVVDRFWLDGPLRISAVEQTRFLADLARDALPFPPALQAATRDIVLLERREDGRELYGKTGWENAPGPGVGWWVGWVRDGADVYAFALNIDMATPADADRRVSLGRAALATLDIY